MRVDKQGYRISNGWYYDLLTPNPWGKPLLGRVWWDEHLANYVFEPEHAENRRVRENCPLNFLPLEEAPAVKQDERLVKRRLAQK